ncbi:MAG: class I tRNA ligase family protein [Candidatus Moranbacteria bacterium]|nr:class I tRNA ligase family protein [Candidatus Moranbacteria bacterium]
MSKDFSKTYNPQEVEDDIYKKWEESGYFNPDNLDGEPYSIMMPPPNVTGVLHLGHAMENSIMDIMIRYQRMNGKKALLLPGTDHAAVATQAKVEKILIEKGIKNPREELGRKKLLNEIREYAENSKSTIISQIRKMGTSCDWSRLAYTFDETRSQAVNTVFVKMHEDGLIYRGHRVINWSVKGQSTCSDDELEHIERPAKLYTFKYSKDFPITIATTRPETKLGDTAVAVNPDDKRYQEFIGKIYTVDVGAKNPLEIKIITDSEVEKDFGTGALGVTPAHSPIDFAMYEKQKAKNDPIGLIQVIDKDGKMTAEAGVNYQGLSVDKAREKFVNYLKENDLLEKEEEITQNVGTSDRFGDVIESIPMTQWFIDVNKKIPGKNKSLKELMQEAVRTGHNNNPKQKINITPKRFEETYFSWIDNLRDWCISRQIWWGHQIPVWYRENNGEKEIFVGENKPKEKYNKVVLLHAWGSDPTEAFFPWLKKELEDLNLHVEAPKLPNAENPNYAEWLSEFKKLNIDEDTIVIGRSLGATLALATAQEGHKFGKLIAVCTPLENEAIPDFFNDIGEWKFDKIKNNISEIEVLHSTDDPYIPNEMSEKLSEKLNVPLTIVKKANHFTGDKHQEILDSCKLWQQDPDTLDTWFSSGLWTFSTLGWPEKTKDFKDFHPTNFMTMGRDIIFFWMARMILMTTYTLDEIPFKDVYPHGMLTDKEGNKFSKSLGNAMDPIDIVEEYGADALRLSCITGISPGNDLKIYPKKIESSRNFTTKLWNIGRYINSACPDLQNNIPKKYNLTTTDKWILTKLIEITKEATADIEKYDFSQASEKLRNFTRNDFADWYVEVHKIEKNDAILIYVYKQIVKMWHPFIPFVTEKIWQEMFATDKNNLLMVEKWTDNKTLKSELDNPELENNFALIQELIVKIRNIRSTYNVAINENVTITLVNSDENEEIKENKEIIKKLGNISEIKIIEKDEIQKQSASDVVGDLKLYVHLENVIDIKKEKNRIEQDLRKTIGYQKGLEKRLSSEQFVSKAPENVVNQERDNFKKTQEKIIKLEEHLKNLS